VASFFGICMLGLSHRCFNVGDDGELPHRVGELPAVNCSLMLGTEFHSPTIREQFTAGPRYFLSTTFSFDDGEATRLRVAAYVGGVVVVNI